MNDDKFRYQEKHLTKIIGVNRRELTKIRKSLVQGGHWILNSGAVSYSQSGVKRLLSALELPYEKLPPFLIPPQPGEAREMIVTRVYRNRKLIGAELDGQLQRIRVQSNKNFRRGMKIPTRHINGDIWELARRCPRWPGRW